MPMLACVGDDRDGSALLQPGARLLHVLQQGQALQSFRTTIQFVFSFAGSSFAKIQLILTTFIFTITSIYEDMYVHRCVDDHICDSNRLKSPF